MHIITGRGKFYDQAKDVAWEFAGKVCRESFWNSPFINILSQWEHFRSERTFSLNTHLLPLGSTEISLSADGIGTKVVLADTIGQYKTMAADLLAMALDDVARFGWLPLVYTNVIDVRSMDSKEQKQAFMDLMSGLAEVAKKQDIVLLQWETATLWDCIGSPNQHATLAFNWSGTVMGIANEKLRITQDIEQWDYIVALKQDGFRSNGISKVRKAFELKYWPNWYQDAPRLEIEAALSPSVPYARAISQANGWYDKWEKEVQIKWIAHLSGGSFASKFLEPMLIPKWLSARLDTLFEIPEITKKAREWLMEWGQSMSDEEMFKTWCCGQWMLVMFGNQAEAEKFVSICERFWVAGKIAGQIYKNQSGEDSKLIIE
jgi:phosphoribosylformylglycinamidine cyclo-ligase